MTNTDLQRALDALGEALDPYDAEEALNVLAMATGALLAAHGRDRPAYFEHVEAIAASAMPSGKVQ